MLNQNRTAHRLRLLPLAVTSVLSIFMQARKSSAAFTFSDDFNGSPLDACTWRSGVSGTGQLPVVQSGAVLFTIGAGASGYATVVSKYSFAGDFDASVDFNLLQFPYIYKCDLGMQMESSDGQALLVKRQRQEGHDQYVATRILGPGSWLDISVVNTTQVTGRFRVTRTGTMFQAYYWSGGSWVSLGSATFFSGPVRLRLLSFNNPPGYPGFSGAFDNASIVADGAFALDADLNGSCGGDGMDISQFVSALLDASTDSSDLFHADFNANGVIDVDDIPGFTQKLLGF